MADDSKPQVSKRIKRRRQILAATMRLVKQQGCNVSTAEIAAAAHCSKETLYNWFSDRDGIFDSLIAEQGAAMVQALQSVSERYEKDAALSPQDRLGAFGAGLLDIMTGDAFVVVDRIAMARTCEQTNEAGGLALGLWRENVVARFDRLIDDAGWEVGDIDGAWHTYAGLLIGDRQRPLLLGQDSRPSGSQMQALAKLATDRWCALHLS